MPTREQRTDTLVGTIDSRLENWSRDRAEKREAESCSEQLCRAHERTVKNFFFKNWGGPSANFYKTEGARLQIFKKLGGGAGPPQAPMDGTPMVERLLFIRPGFKMASQLSILPNTRPVRCSRVANSVNRSTYRYLTESFD